MRLTWFPFLSVSFCSTQSASRRSRGIKKRNTVHKEQIGFLGSLTELVNQHQKKTNIETKRKRNDISKKEGNKLIQTS